MTVRLQRRPLWFAFLAVLLPNLAWGITPEFAGFDLWPSIGEHRFFSLSSSENLFRRQFQIDFANSFAWRSLDLIGPGGVFTRSVVNHYIGHQLSGAYGIFDFWQLGLTATFFSNVRFEPPLTDPSPGIANTPEIGDLRLASRIRLIDANRKKWGLGLEPFLSAPLGGGDHYVGDGQITTGLKVIGDVIPHERIRVAANVGVELRPERVFISNVDFQHRFLSNLGLWGNLGKGFGASAEVGINTGFRSFFSDEDTTPIEYLGYLLWESEKSGLRVGGGFGSCVICGGKGAKIRGLFNIGYRRPARYLIKEEPPEPEQAEIVVTPEEIFTYPGVHFEFDKYEITPEGAQFLTRFVEVLRKHPDIKTIWVVGHCDVVGSDAYNLLLSYKRAESVIHYIRGLGVTPEEINLIPMGQSFREPVASNDTQEGRDINRRVIFKRLDVQPATETPKEQILKKEFVPVPYKGRFSLPR